MTHHILVINTGSTSTKFALYVDCEVAIEEKIEHSAEDLAPFGHIGDQLAFRTVFAEDFAASAMKLYAIDTIVAIGGMLPPVKSGCYEINEAMCTFLYETKQEHASNLAAFIANGIAKKYGISNVFIYDPVSVDELTPVAKISGIVDLPRNSFSHALNMRSIAHKTAETLNKAYDEANIIVAHLGGGFSLSVHSGGKMIDIISDDEGPFSPERAGRQQATALTKYMYSIEGKVEDKLKILRGGNGLLAHLKCSNAKEAEDMVLAGDEKATLIFQAMAYQTAKGIGELATVTCGKIDAIALTGGVANSKCFTDMITERVSFIAPVYVFPGENEMEALAFGAFRVLNGEEPAHQFKY